MKETNTRLITVFSLSSSKKLAQDIASILGTKVGDCKVHHFADGEILCEIGESVRGKDVFIVQSTSNPVTENLMEILVLTDALKRASARAAAHSEQSSCRTSERQDARRSSSVPPCRT